MFWTNPLIDLAVASGTGIFTFGLLAMSKAKRRFASRPGLVYVEAPVGSGIKSAPAHENANGSRHAQISIRPSGILMCAEPRRKDEELAVHRPLETSSTGLTTADKFQINYIPWTPPVWDDAGIEGQPTAKNAHTADPDAPKNMASRIYAARQRASEEGAQSPKARPAAAGAEKPTAAGLLKFFGFRKQPFDVTPDPQFLYLSPSHSDALGALSQGVEHFRGILSLVAEPGMGKTMLLNRLIEDLSGSARVIYVFQSQYNSRELLSYILDELEVEHSGMDMVAMHRALHQALLEEMLRGRRFVVILDEAHNLQEPELETIRLLSDYETTQSKLIQIILAGQPQLAETLAKPGLAQLRQRIASVSKLNPLNAKETAEYVDHRLRAAGWNGGSLFTRDALALVAELSKGVPRNVNNLCFNALFAGLQRGEQIVDAGMVRKAAERLNLESAARPRH